MLTFTRQHLIEQLDIMNKCKEIFLYDLIGAAVIVLDNSGIIYTNQTSGSTCLQSSERGFLCPINNSFPAEEFDLSIEYLLSSMFIEVQSLNNKLADDVDELFKRYPETFYLRVDRNRLSESHESWVYVDVAFNENCWFNSFGQCKAVLTWPNSD